MQLNESDTEDGGESVSMRNWNWSGGWSGNESREFEYAEADAEERGHLMRRPAVRIPILCAYCLLLGSSIVCNALIVLFVAAKRKMHTVMNIFVANLACADILMCMFSGMLTPVSMLFIEDWTLGDTVCKLVPATCMLSVLVISWSSTLIAAERYWAIVHPHAKRMQVSTAVYAGATVWVVAALFTLPVALNQSVVDQDGDGVHACTEHWGELVAYRAAYTYLCLIVQYLLPALLITFAYTKILLVLGRRLKQNMAKVVNSQRENKVEKLRQKQRVTRILVIMIASFMICWVPLNVFSMIVEHKPRLFATFRYGGALFISCHLVASSSTLLNAVLYAGMNYEFRRQLHLDSCASHLCCHPHTHHSLTQSGSQRTTKGLLTRPASAFIRASCDNLQANDNV